MNKDNNHGLLVVGAGQMRTGTLSLKTALQILYGGKCYHMEDVFLDHLNHVKIWIKAFDQGFLDEELSKELFKGYIAAVDYPTASFYKDLMKIYPNSKVILGTRNSSEWVKSVRNTTIPKPSILVYFKEKFIMWSGGFLEFEELREKYFLKSLGQPMEVLQRDDEILKKCFEEYNDEVRRSVPKERLLEFNAKDGWEPLCRFLDLPIPDYPFPSVNNTKDFNQEMRSIIYLSLLKYGSIVAISVISSIFIYRKWKC